MPSLHYNNNNMNVCNYSLFTKSQDSFTNRGEQHGYFEIAVADIALIDRLKKHKGAVCLFLEKLGVPFDNNQAERDIRNIKTKTKVCGCFRSRTGAEEYMGLMSFISTARKNGFDSYHAVKMVLSGQINQFFGVGC